MYFKLFNQIFSNLVCEPVLEILNKIILTGGILSYYSENEFINILKELIAA